MIFTKYCLKWYTLFVVWKGARHCIHVCHYSKPLAKVVRNSIRLADFWTADAIVLSFGKILKSALHFINVLLFQVLNALFLRVCVSHASIFHLKAMLLFVFRL